MSQLIEVKNLKYTYKSNNVQAVKGISFKIEKGEIFGFLGPSGSGKSTTQNILIKLLDSYEGDIKIYGKDLLGFGSDLYESIGISFELPNHFLKLTARENLSFFKSLYNTETREIDELLESVGLIKHKDEKVEGFSKGMKIRLNFARALLNNGEILFLDEPTSGLDPVNAKIVKDIILKEKCNGKTIFITTHDMGVADELCDRVAFMVEGVIVDVDKPQELKLKHGESAVRIEYYQDKEIKTVSFELEKLGNNDDFINIIKNNKIRTIHSQETTLEDVFIKVTGRGLD